MFLFLLLLTVPVTSNASHHFKSSLAMGEMPFKIKRASSVPISVVIDTGVNSTPVFLLCALRCTFLIGDKFCSKGCSFWKIYFMLRVNKKRVVR